FPSERAVFRSGTTPEDFRALFGVALSPPEVMDLLTGKAPPRVSRYQAWWGPVLPRRVKAVLSDDARLDVTVREARLDAGLPAAASRPPPHAGFHEIGPDEARRLWSAR